MLIIYRALTFLIALAVLNTAAFPMSKAQAQVPFPSDPNLSRIQPLSLTNQTTEIYPDAQSLFVVEDTGRQLGFNSIIGMIQNGQIARSSYEDSVITLGSNSHPFWVVIPVLNTSDREIWSLDFGQSGYGRSGFVHKAILYESSSRQTFFNSTTRNDAQAKSFYLPSTISVTLPQNKPAYLILYLEGRKGVLTAFKPSLHSSLSAEGGFDFFKPDATTLLMTSILILLTGFLFRRDYSFLTIAAMWSVLLTYETLLDHYFLIDNFFAAFITPTFRLLFPVLLFVSLWLTSGAREKYPSSLFLGTGLLFAVCSLLGMLLLSSATPFGISLSFVPLIGISLLSVLLTWPFASIYAGNSLSGIVLISRAILFISVWGAVETIHPISSAQSLVYLSPWLAGICAVVSALLQIRFSEHAASTEIHEPKVIPDSYDDNLRVARENSENNRLLQVLEQERALMKNLQAQDALQTEEMKKAKESADEANLAKSAFLAVVSHEIRTPMTGIMGMVRLILDTGLSREQKEYANTIQDSGEALLSLLNDILDFEKIESGKLELEKTNFDLRRLLKGIHVLMSGHAASKNVGLILDMDEKLPHFVVGDPTRLRQVLLNLVNNAIKFTARGNVTMQIKDLSVAVSGETSVRQLYFGIQDSGIGISPESQKKIFMPFSQADSSINRKFGGTGLGLTICKKLIEAMGSSIGINSREGEGSTFFFTLPMEVASDESNINKPVTVLTDTTGKKLRVLVVDDNGINQKVLHGLLGRLGHYTVLASNAAEALQAVQESAFDLVLMDIELPGKSGLEVTQDIRALSNQAAASLPIVAMTGNTGQSDIQKYLTGGMNDFLGKPVMPENLKQILYKTARGDFIPVQAVPPPVSPIIISPQEEDHAFDMEGEDFSDNDDFESAVRQFEEQQQSAEGGDESFLDANLIASLIKSLGKDQTQELMKDFYEKTEELIRDLRAASDANDDIALKARAHELRGMAANFGFKVLAANANIIEKDLLDNKEADLRPLLENLAGLYHGSRVEMEKLLES